MHSSNCWGIESLHRPFPFLQHADVVRIGEGLGIFVAALFPEHVGMLDVSGVLGY